MIEAPHTHKLVRVLEFSMEQKPVQPGSGPLAVSPAKAAEMAGIGRTKLYELMAMHKLRSFKLGTRRLIRVSDIQDFIDSLVED